MEKAINTYVIDLFCGAGGTSTAIHKSDTNISVIACINHDKNAIISHAENYPDCLHLTEDIRTVWLKPIRDIIYKLRRDDPTCKIAIWASLECTNFSKAKCGPKDCDSRTLAEHLFRYLDYLNPDFLWIENVEEFMTWGPLDEFNNPIKEQEGEHFKEWCDKLKSTYFSTMIHDTYVSADYAGYTIRKRLFMQFSKDGITAEPVKTHSKDGSGGLLHWLPVKDVLELENHGASIFTRKKDFVRNTHRRILKGLNKFEKKRYGIKYYGVDGFQDLKKPCATLTTKDRISLVSPSFLKQNYGTSYGSSLFKPAPTLTRVPKADLVSIKFLHNPQYGGSNRSIDDPAYTIIARQDKAPAGITTAVKHEIKRNIITIPDDRGDKDHITVGKGEITYFIYNDDDEYMVGIKQYMYDNFLGDVLVRPLTIPEMLSIQGFPKGYILMGNTTEQKKYIGNSVEVNVGIALFEAIDSEIQKLAA